MQAFLSFLPSILTLHIPMKLTSHSARTLSPAAKTATCACGMTLRRRESRPGTTSPELMQTRREMPWISLLGKGRGSVQARNESYKAVRPGCILFYDIHGTVTLATASSKEASKARNFVQRFTTSLDVRLLTSRRLLPASVCSFLSWPLSSPPAYAAFPS